MRVALSEGCCATAPAPLLPLASLVLLWAKAKTARHNWFGVVLEAGERVWCRAVDGVLKINCDAAVDNEKGCDIGVIIRDSTGGVVWLGSRRVQATGSVEVVEVEAVLWATKVSCERGCERVCFESDCLVLVMKLNSGSQMRGELGMMIKEIKRMAASFELCWWVHVRRQANKVADFIAALRPCVERTSDYFFIPC